MSRKSLIILVLACCALSQQTVAGDGIRLVARAGYSIGATSPIGIPEGVKSIDAFRPTPSFTLGIDAAYPLGARWNIATGLRLENKAMDADVTAQGYHMELHKGTEHLEGVFTGSVSQQVSMLMLTLPIYAIWQPSSNWRLKAGPCISLLLKKDFSGTASNGYLRQGGPTGPKITIGDTPETWATYDFSNDMRRFQLGLTIGADWQALPRLGFSLDLGIGLTGIFPSDFSTVEQPLYPLYGTVGICYNIL